MAHLGAWMMHASRCIVSQNQQATVRGALRGLGGAFRRLDVVLRGVEPRVRAADVGEREVLGRRHAEAVNGEAGRLQALRVASNMGQFCRRLRNQLREGRILQTMHAACVQCRKRGIHGASNAARATRHLSPWQQRLHDISCRLKMTHAAAGGLTHYMTRGRQQIMA